MTAMKKPKFKSDAFEAIHSAASGMRRAGVMDKATMREFDESWGEEAFVLRRFSVCM